MDDYRISRNKERQLIRQAKREHFSNKVDICKNSAALWKHMRTINKGDVSSTHNLPAELVINNKSIFNSEQIALELNKFFATIAEKFSQWIWGITPKYWQNKKLCKFESIKQY